MTALDASSAGKAMRENPAFEIAVELPLDIRRTRSALPTVTGDSSQVARYVCTVR
ncbi:hypothetical protein [Candidatus Accumulibacter contiguus]|uniref:hypothetical protein n=1 Tax=Candidatus Accumulibacter contiguus TaxID=2954381 RepID=UPI0038CBFE9B